MLVGYVNHKISFWQPNEYQVLMPAKQSFYFYNVVENIFLLLKNVRSLTFTLWPQNQ